MTPFDGWATRIVRLGAVEVWIDDAGEYLETRWPDGLKLGATPDAATGTTWQQTVDHELGHTWLADQTGAWSLSMRRVKHERDGWPHYGRMICSDDQVAAEEARVLAWQATLPADGARPWDAHTEWATDARHDEREASA